MGKQDDTYADAVKTMWTTMATMHPAEFMGFTANAAHQIASVVENFDIDTDSDFDQLAVLLPMTFAFAMARAADPMAKSRELPPEPARSFLRSGATACRRIAAPDSDGADFAFKIGPHAAHSVLEGVDDVDYIRWSIYRSYLELILGKDPLPAETESSAIALFQSGLRISGWA